jgi:hypothetical protein
LQPKDCSQLALAAEEVQEEEERDGEKRGEMDRKKIEEGRREKNTEWRRVGTERTG